MALCCLAKKFTQSTEGEGSTTAFPARALAKLVWVSPGEDLGISWSVCE